MSLFQLGLLIGVLYGAGVMFSLPNFFLADGLTRWQRFFVFVVALTWPIALPCGALYEAYDNWKFERAIRDSKRESSSK